MNKTITVKDINTLADIYEALAGVCSEMGIEFFDEFYAAGGEQMAADFEAVLKRLGVRIA